MSDDSRLYLEKIEGRLGEKCRQHQAPLSMRNNSKLRKKFIWEASAVKESVRKIQCRNYDEGTDRTPRKKLRLEHRKVSTATRDLR